MSSVGKVGDAAASEADLPSLEEARLWLLRRSSCCWAACRSTGDNSFCCEARSRALSVCGWALVTGCDLFGLLEDARCFLSAGTVVC